MSGAHSVQHPPVPDDPEARAIINAYEATVEAEGVRAAYEQHFTDDCFYVFYGNSPLAGRYEGRDGLWRWWTALTDRIELEMKPVMSLAANGIVTCFISVTASNARGEEARTTFMDVYETRDGRIVSGRFLAFDQDEFDAPLA